MIINDENRTKLRQTLAQMKHELGVLQQSLESAPPTSTVRAGGYYNDTVGYTIDEYILAFRLGNVSDLSMHLHEVFHLTKGKRDVG